MSDLDDFFAKKDKRKCGNKSECTRPLTKPPGIKSITPVQIGLRLIEDCDVTRKNRCDSRGAEDEDDEWKPFDSEEKKDYSGLKIQALVLPETDEADPETSDENRKQPNGPWKISDLPTTECEPSDGAYVNPIQRVIEKRTEIKASHAAPDVKSNIVFPTLSEGLKGGTNQSLGKKRFSSRPDQNRDAKPVEITSRTIPSGFWNTPNTESKPWDTSRTGPHNTTDTECKPWEISRNGPRNTWKTETKQGQISRNGPRHTINIESKQEDISRNDLCKIIEPQFEQKQLSRLISTNSPRNGVASKPNELLRNPINNTVDSQPKSTRISRNESQNTATIEDSMPNRTQLYKIPTNRLNTPKINVGRNVREILNPTGGIPEGKFIDSQSEPAPRVGKYLPPGLRQKFSAQMGS